MRTLVLVSAAVLLLIAVPSYSNATVAGFQQWVDARAPGCSVTITFEPLAGEARVVQQAVPISSWAKCVGGTWEDQFQFSPCYWGSTPGFSCSNGIDSDHNMPWVSISVAANGAWQIKEPACTPVCTGSQVVASGQAIQVV